MNPDHIPTFPVLENSVCKGLIDVDIVDPGVIFICLALRIIRNLVVEHGPEDGLAVMRIMSVKVAIRHKDSHRILFVLKFLRNVGFDVVVERVSWHA